METTATLRCPDCTFPEELEMPVDYCLFFHECANCHTVLRPRDGDDCVFCSYADKDYHPKQAEAAKEQT